MEIPSHRKQGRLTLEQFKEYRSQGMGINEMPVLLKVSKSHVQFLSALDQEKFGHLTKELFEKDYHSGMPLFDVADKYKISRDHIGFLREYFEIEKKIRHREEEKPLTARQKEIIYGTLLGVAGKMSSSTIKIKQSTKQRAYVMWKFGELQEHVSLTSLQEETSFDKRNNKTYVGVRFYTKTNTEVETIISQFYPNGVKRVSKQILDQLDPLGIAVWFMDSGRTDHTLCTDNFTEQEVSEICGWFVEKWDIECHPLAHGKNWRVYFTPVGTTKLLDLIRPHVVSSMLYKVEKGVQQ